jgi:hypothetical protein
MPPKPLQHQGFGGFFDWSVFPRISMIMSFGNQISKAISKTKKRQERPVIGSERGVYAFWALMFMITSCIVRRVGKWIRLYSIETESRHND